jgi:flagellar biosynthesis/type III secretory pathway protein FliH
MSKANIKNRKVTFEQILKEAQATGQTVSEDQIKQYVESALKQVVDQEVAQFNSELEQLLGSE